MDLEKLLDLPDEDLERIRELAVNFVGNDVPQQAAQPAPVEPTE